MIQGRWDVTVHGLKRVHASWFEITDEGGKLSGRFVGIEGSARPMTEVNYEGEELYFRLPSQYEKHKGDLVFKGTLVDDEITGETNDENDNWVEFTAVPAPKLEYREVEWGEPINLIGEDLSNWGQRFSEYTSGWGIKEGVLSNTPPSVDIITRDKYTDFKLHAEWRVPEKGNSGIYLRGRYEIQILDDHDREPDDGSTGSIYGYLKPSKKMTKPVREWNTYDITFIGRWVTIVFNGETIIDRQEIPGLTGGALDSNEGVPGPIMLQGDHRAVEFRNLVLTPARP
ncbi:MAG: DUF1080 domain-containing protein [Candidatus Bathyarchaeota archaeon]|nr:DUF1080 domain-containing protein [Candidatus Bathyarchaeota archaeon]